MICIRGIALRASRRTTARGVLATRIQSLIARFHSVHARTLALQFSDDPFATEAATDRILGLYANCEAKRVAVTPADVGGQAIGHFGFFRSRFRSTLWRLALDWLHDDRR